MKESTFRQRMIGNVCQYDFLLYWALIIEIVLLLFALLSFFLGDLDPETEVILILDFILIGGATVATLGLKYMCARQG